MKGKLYVVIVEGLDGYGKTSWRETKTYWAKKDGLMPKHLTDLIQFWSGAIGNGSIKLNVYGIHTVDAETEDISAYLT